MEQTLLLVIAFAVKLLSRSHLFTFIRWKYGDETIRQCRVLERSSMRFEKSRCDLSFLLTCKKERLTPNFAKPKLSIEADWKVKRDIAKLIV